MRCFARSAPRPNDPCRGPGGGPRVTRAEALEAFGENSPALRIARAETAGIAGRARQSRSYANPAFSLLLEDLSRSGEDYWEATE
ncbi:MAG: hypothetical protein OXH08_17160 [Gammaproteobacteria bacterium]|nr:hypothetical protein [Gammaproteobacteria bacterium]MDE0651021.1 hypothetical protein [Gammaproteobacteria bacterium]